MKVKFSALATSLAIASAVLTGCSQDDLTAVASLRIPIGNQGGAPFSTHLTQEVTDQPVWAGDPDGTGYATVTVNLGKREICWDMSVANIELPATASHIHRAAPGVRGGIVVPLTAPDGTGASVGCLGDVAAELLTEILQSPSSFYVNVHTTDYAPGAIRGQFDR